MTSEQVLQWLEKHRDIAAKLYKENQSDYMLGAFDMVSQLLTELPNQEER